MKLGTETGSLINHVMSGNVEKPEVGMGCTILYWTDRHAATVVEVSKSGHKIVVQCDKTTRSDSSGMSESQQYTYERDPNGATYEFRRTKSGYRIKGGGYGLGLGYRKEYYDYSF